MTSAVDWFSHSTHTTSYDRTISVNVFNGDGDPWRVLRFRHFRVLLDERSVYSGSEELQVGGRAFDLLVVLLRGRGRIVTKTEIFEHVWPSLNVDESNLRFQMAVLRKALGQHRDLIRTVPGRGYFFLSESTIDRSKTIDRESLETYKTTSETDRSLYLDLARENARLRRALSNIVLERMAL